MKRHSLADAIEDGLGLRHAALCEEEVRRLGHEGDARNDEQHWDRADRNQQTPGLALSKRRPGHGCTVRWGVGVGVGVGVDVGVAGVGVVRVGVGLVLLVLVLVLFVLALFVLALFVLALFVLVVIRPPWQCDRAWGVSSPPTCRHLPRTCSLASRTG